MNLLHVKGVPRNVENKEDPYNFVRFPKHGNQDYVELADVEFDVNILGSRKIIKENNTIRNYKNNQIKMNRKKLLTVFSRTQ